MSPVREKFIKVVESIPYDIDQEIFKRSTKEILEDVAKKYIDTYGMDDLSENDKECIRSLIETEI